MQNQQDFDRLIGTTELLMITGLPLSTVYHNMRAGRFPKNIKITRKRVAWRASDLRRWLESRPAYGSKAA
jgi:prophage regulatory protein